MCSSSRRSRVTKEGLRPAFPISPRKSSCNIRTPYSPSLSLVSQLHLPPRTPLSCERTLKTPEDNVPTDQVLTELS